MPIDNGIRPVLWNEFIQARDAARTRIAKPEGQKENFVNLIERKKKEIMNTQMPKGIEGSSKAQAPVKAAIPEKKAQNFMLNEFLISKSTANKDTSPSKKAYLGNFIDMVA